MSKDIFSPILAFTILAGGTAAIGLELFPAPASAPVVASVTLPMVVVTGKRLQPSVVASASTVAGLVQIR